MKRLTFLTCHHKAPLVEAALAGSGFSVETLDSLDTDRFGTFSREVERRSSAHETALAKARLAANHAGTRYGLGSEGSFGRDPYLGMLAWNSELLCWWDQERGYAVYASQGASDTNYAHREVGSLEEGQAFACAAGFPEHGLILGRPGEPWFRKGLQNGETLEGLLREVLATQPGVWIETDMRPHLLQHAGRLRLAAHRSGRVQLRNG